MSSTPTKKAKRSEEQMCLNRIRSKRCHSGKVPTFSREQRACDACVLNYGESGLWTPKRFENWAILRAQQTLHLDVSTEEEIPPAADCNTTMNGASVNLSGESIEKEGASCFGTSSSEVTSDHDM